MSGDPLDSYSATVIRVAATVTPLVAALEMTGTGRAGRRTGGAGSAVLFTSDGYLLTNAHVVGGAASGHAVFADGTSTAVEVVGADPLSDLAVVHGTGADGGAGRHGRRRIAPGRAARHRRGQSARAFGLRHGRGGQRARPVHPRLVRT